MMLVEPPTDRGSTATSTALPVGPQHQLGFNIYTRLCSTCHGSGQTTMRSPVKLGSTQFRALIRQGREQMPGFSDVLLPDDHVAALEGYLLSLPVTRDQSGSGDEFVQLPANLTRYPGPDTRYSGSFSAGWYTSNGYPAIGPPWTQLVAYDLNDGTIKWRVPDGQAPGIPESGGSRTGTVRPRNGPVVTAGGLVFVANAQDRFLRAYDTATGRVALGARARGESRRDSRGVRSCRTSIHRVRRWRVVGHRRRSGLAEPAAPKARIDDGAGVSRLRAAEVTTRFQIG